MPRWKTGAESEINNRPDSSSGFHRLKRAMFGCLRVDESTRPGFSQQLQLIGIPAHLQNKPF